MTIGHSNSPVTSRTITVMNDSSFFPGNVLLTQRLWKYFVSLLQGMDFQRLMDDLLNNHPVDEQGNFLNRMEMHVS